MSSSFTAAEGTVQKKKKKLRQPKLRFPPSDTGSGHAITRSSEQPEAEPRTGELPVIVIPAGRTNMHKSFFRVVKIRLIRASPFIGLLEEGLKKQNIDISRRKLVLQYMEYEGYRAVHRDFARKNPKTNDQRFPSLNITKRHKIEEFGKLFKALPGDLSKKELATMTLQSLMDKLRALDKTPHNFIFWLGHASRASSQAFKGKGANPRDIEPWPIDSRGQEKPESGVREGGRGESRRPLLREPRREIQVDAPPGSVLRGILQSGGAARDKFFQENPYWRLSSHRKSDGVIPCEATAEAEPPYHIVDWSEAAQQGPAQHERPSSTSTADTQTGKSLEPVQFVYPRNFCSVRDVEHFLSMKRSIGYIQAVFDTDGKEGDYSFNGTCFLAAKDVIITCVHNLISKHDPQADEKLPFRFFAKAKFVFPYTKGPNEIPFDAETVKFAYPLNNKLDGLRAMFFDIAVVEIKKPEFHQDLSEGGRYITHANATPPFFHPAIWKAEFGQAVYAMGFQATQAKSEPQLIISVRNNSILSFEGAEVQYSSFCSAVHGKPQLWANGAQPGFSGAPVFLDTGHLVAVHRMGFSCKASGKSAPRLMMSQRLWFCCGIRIDSFFKSEFCVETDGRSLPEKRGQHPFPSERKWLSKLRTQSRSPTRSAEHQDTLAVKE